MRRFAWLSLVALSACQTGDPRGNDRAGSVSEPVARVSEPAAPSARSEATAPPGVALITTRPGARESRVWFQYSGSEPTLVGRVPHLPDAAARGAVVGRTVWVVADNQGSGDDSFGAALFRVEAHSEPALLLERCVHAGRPWATPSGRLLVQRGEPGALPSPDAVRRGELRADALSIDDIDPTSGESRTLHAFRGYITYIAGVTAMEVVLYRVAYRHADLVAVDLESAAVRVLAPEIPAFARDFSVDTASQSVLFTNRDPAGWIVERVALSGGARDTVARVEGPWAKPAVWPRGGLLLNDSRGGEIRGGPGPRRALGPGFDSLFGVSPGGRWAALVHERPDAFSRPYWVELASSSVHPIPVPPGARVDIAGWAP